MENLPIPSFLSGGTFMFDALGYKYSEPPPMDLLSPTSLHHSSPWVVLAAIMERAKKGDFDHMPRLGKMIDPKGDAFLVGICFQLLGDIGTEGAVRTLLPLMTHENDEFVVDACRAAQHCGYLWLVQFIFEAWGRVKRNDDKQTLKRILSEMLEEDRGPISSPEHFAEGRYRKLVEDRLQELRSNLGTDTAPIWAGRLFSVVNLAQEMHKILTTGRYEGFSLYANFLDQRERFEASTGIDCSSFYSSGGVQVSAAKVVLAEFLNSDESKRYKDGVRYFFGHEIPVPRPIKKS